MRSGCKQWIALPLEAKQKQSSLLKFNISNSTCWSQWTCSWLNLSRVMAPHGTIACGQSWGLVRVAYERLRGWSHGDIKERWYSCIGCIVFLCSKCNSVESGKVICKPEHPVDPAHYLHFLSDFSHLIKCVKNTLLSHPLNTSNGTVSVWSSWGVPHKFG